jgi:hypothetical protein
MRAYPDFTRDFGTGLRDWQALILRAFKNSPETYPLRNIKVNDLRSAKNSGGFQHDVTLLHPDRPVSSASVFFFWNVDVQPASTGAPAAGVGFGL